MNVKNVILWCGCVALLFVGCATKGGLSVPSERGVVESAAAMDGLRFVQRVSDNAVYSKNIVSKIDFSINTGGKNISVGGSIHMRKDEVIRIQLTPMGLIEVGRIELTPDYVLIMDRVHKEYIKASYKDVDFLSNNGLNFYSLQALFWNQLFLPGEERVSEMSLERYETGSRTGEIIPIVLRQGSMTYSWSADSRSALIEHAMVAYDSKHHGVSKLDWEYADFKALGSKKFPTNHLFTLSTNASGKSKTINVGIKMNRLSTDGDWDPLTTVSERYKKVSVEDVIRKIMSL